MNVEKLFENFKPGYYFRDESGAHQEGFHDGMKATLAAMFTVVKVEDLKKGDVYFAIGAKGCGPILGRLSVAEKFWDYENQEAYRLSAFTEFRRCPTPSELGVG